MAVHLLSSLGIFWEKVSECEILALKKYDMYNRRAH